MYVCMYVYILPQGDAAGFKMVILSPELNYYIPTFENYQGGCLVAANTSVHTAANASVDPANIPSGIYVH